MKKPTIRTIAEKAGVSASTVSRALNNSPLIPEATRKHILAVADSLEYTRNPIASALAAARSGRVGVKANIAYVVGHFLKNPLKENAHYREMLQGIKSRCDELGFALDVIWAFSPDIAGKLQKVLVNRGIKGVILHSVFEEEVQVDWSGFAVAYLSGAYKVRRGVPKFSYCAIDLFTGMRSAALELGRRGYKRLGIAITRSFSECYQHRLQGALHTFEADGDYMALPSFYYDEFHVDEVVNWVRVNRPDVIIGEGLHLRVIESAVALAGFRVPAFFDVSEKGLRESDYSCMIWPLEELGKTAVDLVSGALNRSEFGHPDLLKVVHIPPKIQWSESLSDYPCLKKK